MEECSLDYGVWLRVGCIGSIEYIPFGAGLPIKDSVSGDECIIGAEICGDVCWLKLIVDIHK